VTPARDQDLATPTPSTPSESAPERPKLQLSATTVTTGVVASTASALLGSTLGVAGTLVGAALGAVAYAIVSALYTHSVEAAKYRVQERRVRTDRGTWSDWAEAAATATVDPASDLVIDESAAQDPVSPATRKPRMRAADTTPTARRTTVGWNWRPVLAGALGSAFAFGLALLLVTGIESFKGAPLSGGSAGGLTVLGGSTHDSPDAVKPSIVPSTGVTTSAVPHPSMSTSTATQTAPETATETATQTATETAVAMTTHSGSPTASESPGASGSSPTTLTSAPSSDPAPQTTGYVDRAAEPGSVPAP
jgi:hypothetical protein